MAVLIEGISVVVRRDVIEQKYPGGIAQYEKDCPTGTFCADPNLTAIRFMIPKDVQPFIQSLERHGIKLLNGNEFAEIAIVDMLSGATTKCNWLSFARKFDGISACWLANTDLGEVAVPKGWEFENSLSTKHSFVSNQEADQKVQFLRSEGKVDVYLDLETGKEVYVGRPFNKE